MIEARRAARPGARARFCHIEVHRAEQRASETRDRSRVVFLVRLSSELGEYPSSSSYYELTYDHFKALHEHLRAHFAFLQLPWLPRMRWLGARHPRYLQEMCETLQYYLQHLLLSWCRATPRIDGFLMMLHSLHEAAAGVPALPLPDELPTSAGDADDAAVGARGAPERVCTSTRAAGGAAMPQALSPSLAEREALGWHHFQAYEEKLLPPAAEEFPFEEDGHIVTGLNCWVVERFTVRRVDQLETDPKLLDGNAYVVLNVVGSTQLTLHYWIGARCPADKAGAAAVMSFHLRQALDFDGGMKYFREEQGRESEEFLNCFTKARVYYEEGGAASGWRRKRSVQMPRLLRVSDGPGCLGSVQMIPPHMQYLDQNAAYILDVPGETRFVNSMKDETLREVGERKLSEAFGGRPPAQVYWWNGSEASLRAKGNSLLVAQTVRAIDRGGACRAHLLSYSDVDRRLSNPMPDDDLSFLCASSSSIVQLPLPPPALPARIFRFEEVPDNSADGAEGDEAEAEEHRAMKLVASEAQVGPGTLCSSVLLPHITCVLDCGAEVYVWTGKRSGRYARWVARTYATRLRKPVQTPPTIFKEVQGSEGVLFRSKFGRWHWNLEANPPRHYEALKRDDFLEEALPRPLSVEADVAMMRAHCEKVRARWLVQCGGGAVEAAESTPVRPRRASIGAEHDRFVQMVDYTVVETEDSMKDQGTEHVRVWLISDSKPVNLPKSDVGVFYSENCYLIYHEWKYDNRHKSLFYWWKGDAMPKVDFLFCRFNLMDELKPEFGKMSDRLVVQGHETERFLKLIQGTVVLQGSHPTLPPPKGDLKKKPKVNLAESINSMVGVVMLQVKRYSPAPMAVMASQVPAQPYYLDSHDVIVLINTDANTIFFWVGNFAPLDLQEAAHAIIKRMCAPRPQLREVRALEGHEPADFWDAMAQPAVDGAAHKASSFSSEASHPAFRIASAVRQAAEWRRAQAARCALMWRVRALGRPDSYVDSLLLPHEERLPGCPKQHRLTVETVAIIDAAVCLFVWVGCNASEEDESLAMEIAQLYAQRPSSNDPPMQVSHVLAGSEPDEFRRLFHGWQPSHPDLSEDVFARRRDKLYRQYAVVGRVLRAAAWPSPPEEQEMPLHSEAKEEVLDAGIVIFVTSSGIVRDTRDRCQRARLLLRQRTSRFHVVDLNAQPAELQTLRLLQKENKIKEPAACRRLPMIFVNGVLLSQAGVVPLNGTRPQEINPLSRIPAELQELEDEGRVDAWQAMLKMEGAVPRAVRKDNLAALRTLDPAKTIHEGWLLKECGLMFGFIRWKSRWCVLQPAGLYYFRAKHPDEHAAGLIPLHDATHRSLSADYTFEVVVPHRSFLFRIERERAVHLSEEDERLAIGKELARWVSALERAHGDHHKLPDGPRSINRLRHQSMGTDIQDALRARASAPVNPRGQATASDAKAQDEELQSKTALPKDGCGWLWVLDAKSSRWQQRWCSLQGRTLLCYSGVTSDTGTDGASKPTDASTSAQTSSCARGPPSGEDMAASFPRGVNIESPVIVLWPKMAAVSTDSVDAPSQHTFRVHPVVGGNHHQLCASTRAQLEEWLALIAAATKPPSIPSTPLPSSPHEASGIVGANDGRVLTFSTSKDTTTPTSHSGICRLPSPDTTHPPTPRGAAAHRVSEGSSDEEQVWLSDSPTQPRRISELAQAELPHRQNSERLDVSLW
ncbi:hypothetical protein AB1Y20_011154 [Prymnesium parvum]|uniref:Uncharacterized protein n=1 Tax=Prymnesium parvum TaxID=97485 RepID=A0AB34IM37_PRYPA